jgi:hypothetical protein
MKGLFERPPALVSPRLGLLRKDQFQISYVTNNIDLACGTFRKRYGVSEFSFLGGPMPSGGEIKVAFSWVGLTLYEIIAARGPGTEFYNELLPRDEFAIRFHHLGFLIHDRNFWQALKREFDESSWPIAYTSLNDGFMDAYYVKAPELGHYLEYIFPYQAGVDFFSSVPVS